MVSVLYLYTDSISLFVYVQWTKAQNKASYIIKNYASKLLNAIRFLLYFSIILKRNILVESVTIFHRDILSGSKLKYYPRKRF